MGRLDRFKVQGQTEFKLKFKALGRPCWDVPDGNR